ncbi:PREDICTED: uncharacterized protein LOC105558445 [Vollenhovia emeryi]|uniref:uncharacterized protein LOC105558445 n=1 Tax=Vollenhovia emeryi TaxID=411798 RepID=UPI0005F46FA6|nr:PREDICTED: uncharacterized protein LOC105558445 [Vollenhovia emeryi]
MDFVNRITKIKTKRNDILVSFDVVSLFTKVPVQDTLDIIKTSKEIPSNLFPLIEHCLTSTYFQFQGEFFEQTTEAAMGSPMSHIIANIFMEQFENEILKKASLKLSMWFRYVDDTFVIWNHGRKTLLLFLTFINSQHPNIQFTMEIEQNSQISFLDILVRRNEDGTLGHHVYRNPTHTDRYLHANSHYHLAQKNSVISSLVHRAHSISEPAALDGELNHLHRALTRNGYSSRNINRTIQKLTNKEPSLNNTRTPEAEKEKKKAVIFPYLRSTTDRFLSKHNIRMIFKPHNKLSEMLPNPKDRRPHLAAPGAYKIPALAEKCT